MSRFEMEKVFDAAKAWTLAAGKNLRDTLHESIDVQFKTSAADLVTAKDKETEEFLVKKIQETFPEHFILGEEGGVHEQEYEPTKEIVWIIDPIDGTTNFVHQKQNFAISIGIFENGQPRIGLIYDPIRDELFHAQYQKGAFLNNKALSRLGKSKLEESIFSINNLWLTPNSKLDCRRLQALVRHLRGTRSMGSAALEMAYVACQRLDGYFTLRLAPWDFAAGLVILGEVGAEMSTVENQPIDVFQKQSIFVAKPELQQEIMQHYILAEEIPSHSKKV